MIIPALRAALTIPKHPAGQNTPVTRRKARRRRPRSKSRTASVAWASAAAFRASRILLMGSELRAYRRVQSWVDQEAVGCFVRAEKSFDSLIEPRIARTGSLQERLPFGRQVLPGRDEIGFRRSSSLSGLPRAVVIAC